MTRMSDGARSVRDVFLSWSLTQRGFVAGLALWLAALAIGIAVAAWEATFQANGLVTAIGYVATACAWCGLACWSVAIVAYLRRGHTAPVTFVPIGTSSVTATQPLRRVVDMVRLKGNGRFGLDVVGESHYQRSLEKICGNRKEHGENRVVEARLILEDDNPYGAEAVRVDITGMTVGYLSRETAPMYRQKLKQDGHPRAIGACQAKIKGGWKRTGEREAGSYGVCLDITRLKPRR